jgi:protein-tyrosine phosphatase
LTGRWALGSAVNFRDLGGKPLSSGGWTRPGVLFRSASPQFLSRSDATTLVQELGLRLVVDLRLPAEAAAEGRGPLGETSVRYRNVPLLGAGGGESELRMLGGHGDLLTRHYISYVQSSPHSFVEIYRDLASSDGLPALVHCAAGKDRTGVVVAVLLDALGVTEEAIVADYARTAEAMPRVMHRLASTPTYAATIAAQEPDDEASLARPETMRAFLAWLRREYGSGRELLLGHGLQPDALGTLQDHLVGRTAA